MTADLEPLSLDERKVRVEEARLRLESRFAHRHLATILTSLISGAAIIVSISQVLQTNRQSKTALDVQSAQATAALELQRAQATAQLGQQAEQAERDWQLRLMAIVLEHADKIFSQAAEERQRAREILDATLPPDRKQQLFAAIENASKQSAARESWRQAAAGVDSAILATKPDTAALRRRLALFRLDRTSEATVTEATSMLRSLGPSRISMATPAYVSAILAGGYEITMWPGTYGRSQCYGVRFGLPTPGRPYFGSNDTYFEVCKQ